MITSGTKKGIATSAVTALAIAGLPLLSGSASAVTHTSTLDANAVDLVAPTTDLSAKPDGQNSTVRLTALGGANVTSVLFEYRIGANGPWTPIGTAATRNDDGTFAFEWNPSALAGSGNVTLRATGQGPATPATDTSGDRAVNNNLDTVNITDGPTLDVFQAPYTGEGAPGGQFAVVEGTSSNSGATPTLDFLDPTDRQFEGRNNTTQSTAAQGAATGSWRGVLNIQGYTYGGDTDEVLVKAAGATDDTESFVINRQQLGAVTAEPRNASAPGNSSRQITITVVDADGDPIAGAEVRRQDGTYVGATNAVGQVTANQAGGTQTFYYANATDSNPYEEGLGDKRSETVTVGQYDPQPSSLEATSANGSVFDYDEYDADDIQVQVKDQGGEDVPFEDTALQTLEYTWTFRAFDGTPSSRETSGTTTVGVDGSADIPLPADRTEGGTYTLRAGLRANPLTGAGGVPTKEVLTVKAGQAAIVFTDDEASAAAGDSVDIGGTLRLEDGTGLPSRPVTLTYTPDQGGNAAFDQPTGNDNVVRRVTTAQDGSFSATLDDPAVAQGQRQPTETGDVEAVTADYDDPNTAGDQDDAEARKTTPVTFFEVAAPQGTKVEITGLQGTGKPGAPAYGTATVTDADGKPVANVAVRLTVDGSSFFTDGPENGTPGQPAGDLNELGQSITRVTNAQGVASFAVGIERSEEFDDDGRATDAVSTRLGGTASGTDTQDVVWSTADPLNGGDVRVERAADRFQESGVLPKAPTTDDVAYDVKVTDQFGNPVGGENVAVSADGGDVVDGSDAAVTTVKSDFDEDPEFELSSDDADEITPTGTWQANTSVYAADSTGGQGDADDDADIVTTDNTDRTTGDGPTAKFYEVDFAASTYTLSQQGEEQREVGETVIMTYSATDQFGEEIEFEVAFFRTGPGNDDDGSADDRVATGEDGMASYVFSGNTDGTARISAIGYVGNQVQPESQARDTVQFGEVDQGPGSDPIEILLGADSNGPKKDIVRLQADEAAAGETVRLYVIRGTKAKGNKRLIEIREDIVPEDGRLTFKKADRNGNRKTRFIAKVRANDNVSKSNTQKPR